MLLKLTVFFLALPLAAQQTLSLQQALAMALDGPGNLDIQLAATNVEQADAQIAQAHALLLPILGISATEQDQSRNLGAEGFRFTDLPGFRIPAQVGPFNTFDSRASIQQTVFNAALFARRKAFQFNAKAQKLAEQQTRETVAGKVAHAYLDVLRHRALLDGIRADLEFTDTKVSIARETLAAGKGIPVDVTNATSDWRDVKIREAEEQAAYGKAKLALLDLCNLELTNDFEPAAVEPWEEKSVKDTVAARPDIASAESAADSARTTDRALRLERLPTVASYADAGVLGGVETHTIGISVNLNVFDGGRLAARRAEALSVLRQEQIKVKQLQRKAQFEVAQAELEIQSAKRQMAIARENRLAANEALQHTKRLVEQGGFDRTIELSASNRSAHAQLDEALASIRLEDAEVSKAEATGSVVEMLHRSFR